MKAQVLVRDKWFPLERDYIMLHRLYTLQDGLCQRSVSADGRTGVLREVRHATSSDASASACSSNVVKPLTLPTTSGEPSSTASIPPSSYVEGLKKV